LAFFTIRNLLAPITVAGILAILFYSSFVWLSQRLRLNKTLTAFGLTLATLCFIVLPLIFTFASLTREASLIYQRINELVSFSEASNSRLWQDVQTAAQFYGFDLEQALQEYLAPTLTRAGSLLSSIFGFFFTNVVNIVLLFVVSLVALFFFLRDGEALIGFLKKVSPLTEQQTEHMLSTFKNVIQAVLLANLLTALVQGILGGIGFWLFGVSAPVFWGTVMFFFALIPFFGPVFIYVPATLYLLLTGPVNTAALYFLYNVLIVSMADNVIKPWVIGDRVKIHPLIIFLSVLGGIQLWGVLGIIYGPLVAAILLLILDLHLRESKQRSLFNGY